MAIFDDNIDLTKHELRNAIIQPLASDPSTPGNGQIYSDTVTNRLKYFDGATFKSVLLDGDVAGAGGDVTQTSASASSGRMKVSAGANKEIIDYTGGAGLVKSDADGIVSAAVVGTDYLTATSTSTLTNKTIDANGTGNALSNVEVADFTTASVNTSTSLAGASDTQFPTALAVKTYADNSFVTASSTDTLTNKTIDANGTGNALSNVEVADFTTASVNTSTSLAGAADTQFPTALAVKTYADNLPFITASSSNTLTNKTFDANGTGNTLSNVETADFAVGVVNTSATLTGATNSQLPSALAVKTYADNLLGANDAMIFQGGIDASANPNYPAADAGDTYRITVAGKIGGASGPNVEVGDTIICSTDATSAGTQAAVGANWVILQTNLDQASTTVAGFVELATNAEALAKSDTVRAVTPAALVGFTQKKTFTFGDAAATSFALTHNLGTQDVLVQVRDASTNEVRFPKIVMTDANTVTISGYLTAPASNSMKAVITG